MSQYEKRLPEPYSDYAATRDGKIYSYKSGERVELSPWEHSSYGYLQIEINDDLKLVHRLILRTFDRPPKDGEWARHLDGNPKNNAIDNLEWGTPTDNVRDKIKHGTSKRKLSNEQAREIYQKYHNEDGWGYVSLAKEYPVGRGTIRRIVKEKIYKDALESLV